MSTLLTTKYVEHRGSDRHLDRPLRPFITGDNHRLSLSGRQTSLSGRHSALGYSSLSNRLSASSYDLHGRSDEDRPYSFRRTYSVRSDSRPSSRLDWSMPSSGSTTPTSELSLSRLRLIEESTGPRPEVITEEYLNSKRAAMRAMLGRVDEDRDFDASGGMNGSVAGRSNGRDVASPPHSHGNYSDKRVWEEQSAHRYTSPGGVRLQDRFGDPQHRSTPAANGIANGHHQLRQRSSVEYAPESPLQRYNRSSSSVESATNGHHYLHPRKSVEYASESPSQRYSRSSSSMDSDLPLVAILDSLDSAYEQNILDGVARVKAFGVNHVDHLPIEVTETAVACLLYHTVSMTGPQLRKFKQLRIVVRCGVGYDNIDLEVAGSRGIIVCNVPAYGVEEVADSTMSHILNLFRRTHQSASLVDKGIRFADLDAIKQSAIGSRRIRGCVLGLVGFGKIGTAVAERAKPFGFRICFYDPYVAEGVEKAMGVERVDSLYELLSLSDCVSLHCPLTADNHHMLDRAAFDHFKPGALLVNTARGGLIDDEALATALKVGRVGAASTDVHENEPNNPFNGSLGGAFNYANTPHNAWYSVESERELRETAAHRVKHIIAGGSLKALKSCVNREFL